MRIRLKVSLAGERDVWQAGQDVPDWDDEDAKRLIARGYAEEIGEDGQPTGETYTEPSANPDEDDAERASTEMDEEAVRHNESVTLSDPPTAGELIDTENPDPDVWGEGAETNARPGTDPTKSEPTPKEEVLAAEGDHRPGTDPAQSEPLPTNVQDPETGWKEGDKPKRRRGRRGGKSPQDRSSTPPDNR